MISRICILILILACQLESSAQWQSIRLFNQALFYDGYASDTVMRVPAPAGVKRLSTSFFTKIIQPEQLDSIGDSLKLRIIVKASCDNYDRIGYIGLAFVPKADTIYAKSYANKIEIARFITPFMNKNIKPDTVPYSFDVSNLIPILKDPKIRDTYNIWCIFNLFGVPYAANTQVAGCAGRKDVFFGTLDLLTTTNQTTADLPQLMLPLSHHVSVNNYQATATDNVGETKKTITITLKDTIENAILTVITSNHGANTGGEEYNRRQHFIYFDDTLAMTYKPGFTSCEPYRKYNTQGNGIYGSAVKTDAQWQSFSNWCPGAYIPIRTKSLGRLEPGNHSFRLEVPDAVFANGEGYFPLSVYLQGDILPKKIKAGLQNPKLTNWVDITNPAVDGQLQFHWAPAAMSKANEISIYDMTGRLLLQKEVKPNSSMTTISLKEKLGKGFYVIQIRKEDQTHVQKIEIQ